jgi:hypothetical protein
MASKPPVIMDAHKEVRQWKASSSSSIVVPSGKKSSHHCGPWKLLKLQGTFLPPGQVANFTLSRSPVLGLKPTEEGKSEEISSMRSVVSQFFSCTRRRLISWIASSDLSLDSKKSGM